MCIHHWLEENILQCVHMHVSRLHAASTFKSNFLSHPKHATLFSSPPPIACAKSKQSEAPIADDGLPIPDAATVRQPLPACTIFHMQ
jgi:hypothetical protein